MHLWCENPPVLKIQPAPEYEYIFGFVEVGETIEKEMYIINAGQGILSGSVIVDDTSQSSSNDKEEKVFSISGDINFSLFENQSAIIKIQFTPLKAKEYQGKLKIVASEGQSAEVALKGIGNKQNKVYYIFGCGERDFKKGIFCCSDYIVLLLLIFFLSKRKKVLVN